LAGHFFAAPRGELFSQDPEEEEGERPILHPGGLELLHTDIIPSQIQYTALGHLHRPQKLTGGPCPVVYSGTPLAYSLSEREQPKEVVLIEAEPGKTVKIVHRPLKSGKPIYRKQFSHAAEAMVWLKENPQTYVELLLETQEFITSEVKNSLYEAHDGILALIPVFPGKVQKTSAPAKGERGRSVPDLFSEYFKQVHGGVAPGEELMSVLTEVLGGGEVIDETN